MRFYGSTPIDGQYLLVNFERTTLHEKFVVFWDASNQGYTNFIEKARLFSEDEVKILKVFLLDRRNALGFFANPPFPKFVAVNKKDIADIFGFTVSVVSNPLYSRSSNDYKK